MGVEENTSTAKVGSVARRRFNPKLRFILGAIVGFGLGIALIVISGEFPNPIIADAVASSLTFIGIGLAVLGYVELRRGNESILSDFFFGFGAGLIIVSFLGAGNGTLTLM